MERGVMYAIVQDVPATWEHYERSLRPLIEPAPEGLILHAAGKTDEGYRTIEVWEGEDAWKRFRRERLCDVSDDGGLLAEDARFRDFTPEYLVVSAVLAEAKSTPRKESSA
ncbi:MAG: hypothetical protein H0T10_01790 [Actinobacteria bacterium]|nr:hypothetical protein [Actinomycetota bacterium]